MPMQNTTAPLFALKAERAHFHSVPECEASCDAPAPIPFFGSKTQRAYSHSVLDGKVLDRRSDFSDGIAACGVAKDITQHGTEPNTFWLVLYWLVNEATDRQLGTLAYAFLACIALALGLGIAHGAEPSTCTAATHSDGNQTRVLVRCSQPDSRDVTILATYRQGDSLATYRQGDSLATYRQRVPLDAQRGASVSIPAIERDVVSVEATTELCGAGCRQ